MDDVVPIGEKSALLFLLSFLIMVTTLVLAVSRKTAFGPRVDRRFNRATLTLGMFATTITLHIALINNNLHWYPTRMLDVFFRSLQVMLANSNITRLQNACLPQDVFETCLLYEHIVYTLAPVSSILSLLYLLTDIMTPIRIRIRSLNKNTYILTPLNDRTLALATSIREREPGACLIFADTSTDINPNLSEGIRTISALSSHEPVERLLDKLFKKGTVRVVFDSDDGADNVTRAYEIQRQAQGNNRWRKPSDIFAVTSLYGSDTLPLDDDIKHASATIHRIDWTRNLVTNTLERYPLFLKSIFRNSNSRTETRITDRLLWQKRMYVDHERHVVIVGAGHVGTEFLRLALSFSKIHGLSFRFDVFDNVVDPMNKNRCVAERVMTAHLPELFDKTKLNEEESMETQVVFHLCDARSTDFFRWVEKNVSTITYVFVSLGDDVTCAETAIRIREVLERGLTRNCRGRDREKSHESYDAADRQVLVAVIDNDEIAKSLRRKNRQGRNRAIEVVGLPKEMYGYRQMDLGETRRTSYERLSATASKLHARSRLFAYIRREEARCNGLWLLPIDWESDWRTSLRETTVNSESATTIDAIRRYNAYCRETSALRGRGMVDHEWLLRMEHSRWNTYMRAEGYQLATKEDVSAYFKSTLQDGSPHRSDLALLHPCLVPFDDLPTIDKEIDQMREAAGLDRIATSFQLKNDKHILIEVDGLDL